MQFDKVSEDSSPEVLNICGDEESFRSCDPVGLGPGSGHPTIPNTRFTRPFTQRIYKQKPTLQE
jgi:hypothetical protein